ncbi:class I SAM-dependent methyltransferase [Maliponia aquimaris]|uniref:class I SAM-dependent methyltransferase n=1 Tax=Maliponia aquimaris TaxID=1673631 RepID=UPI001FE5E175|nr:class I SAM-dependent methyltransferase [Maliponia aquimaris]
MSTIEVYQRVAEGYDRSRDQSLFEKPWLDRLLADVPPGGKVLDLGCGSGRPIGAYLAAQGYAVTGVDAAPAMLDLYARHVPEACVVLADMRDLALDARFDAIVGWGSFFHLDARDQRRTLPRIARHLAPGGRLLLTVGPSAGEAWGQVEGEAVYHASLAPEDYAALLAAAGAPVEAYVPEDPSCRGHSLLLARRPVADKGLAATDDA